MPRYDFSLTHSLTCPTLIPSRDDVQNIFELWCEVSTSEEEDMSGASIEANNNNGAVTPRASDKPQQPVVHRRYPAEFSDSRVLADISHFAFPCEFEK